MDNTERQPMMSRIKEWHRTKLGLLVFGIAEFAIAYGLATIAIDRGNLLWYILTLIFVVGFFQNLVKLIWKFVHGSKEANS